MSLHSYTKMWAHLIWSTHNREKVLTKGSRKLISDFLYKYAKGKKIYMKINYVNAEHIHTLIDLPTNIAIEECVKLPKGSSSHFINQKLLTNKKFKWARGYGAFSVSGSNVDKVIKYIKNQEEHHRVKSFAEEFELFLKKYGVQNVKNG